MCVTNTVRRSQQQPISLGSFQSSGCPSGLTQRLLSSSAFAASAPAATQNGNVVFKPAPVAAPVVAAPLAHHPPAEKPRPKRRRKPQKPGKTAKMNDRHFVVHNYHDHSLDSEDLYQEQPMEDPEDPAHNTHRRKGGVAVAFPLKLHAVLDQVEVDGLAHIISWQPHGRCFVIHNPKEFVDHVMPKYFRQTKLTSFQRQLNLYGFCRLTRGPDSSGYYHELFLRGKTFLCKKMVRTKVKGTRFKAASSPDQEPDFYTMPPVVTVTPPHSSDEEASHGSSSHYDDSSSGIGVASTVFGSAPYQPPIEPVPVQYNNMNNVPNALVEPPMPALAPLSVPPVASVASWPMPEAVPPTTNNNSTTDRVLDEAVDELFLLDGATTNGDELADFVHDWDPSNNSFVETLENDEQLGFMLEKLLSD